MNLFKKGESGHYSFVSPYTGPTGRESLIGNLQDTAFEGKGLSVGMLSPAGYRAGSAVIFHAGIENPTWAELEDIASRVNRAWRVAYGDTTHVFFEGASLYADTLWLWFGS